MDMACKIFRLREIFCKKTYPYDFINESEAKLVEIRYYQQGIDTLFKTFLKGNTSSVVTKSSFYLTDTESYN